jgi:hypothetical protein
VTNLPPFPPILHRLHHLPRPRPRPLTRVLVLVHIQAAHHRHHLVEVVDEVVEKVVVEEDGTAAILPRRHHLAATVVRRHRLVRVMYLDLIGAGGEREAVLVLVDEKGVPNDPRHHPRSF